MAVQAPGSRCARVGAVINRGSFARAMRRALPSLAPLGGRRGTNVGLSMTSMIDVLVVLTVFLLLTFSASDQCGCRRDLSAIPPAVNVSDMLDAPLVDVRADSVWIDGVMVASHGDIEAAQGKVARLDGLFDNLKAKRETSKLISPGKDPPTHIILAIEGDVPAGIVKSVVMTAARSGYPSIDFMVHVAPKG
jgi:hypothetical protein